METMILNDENFTEAVLTCEDYIKTAPRNKKVMMKQLVLCQLPDMTPSNRWAALIASEVFRKAIGEWERVDGNILYYEPV